MRRFAAIFLALRLRHSQANGSNLVEQMRRFDAAEACCISQEAKAALKVVMSIVLILHGAPVSAQTLEIKLVDGRDGSPMVGPASYVNVWIGTERKEAIVIPTDGAGVARLQLTLNTGEVNIPNSKGSGSIVAAHPIVKYDELFRINAPYVLCGSEGSKYSWLRLENFSTTEILHHGYASPNTCGKVTVWPQPGQVILFVRPLTWREQLKQ